MLISFLHSCMKIVVAMVMEIIKILQKQMDHEIAQELFKLP